MRILFLTDDREDYLADSVLHGLKQLEEHEVVDYPQKTILYKDSPHISRTQKDQRDLPLYGNGFTLYGLLPNKRCERDLIHRRIESSWFDLAIVGNIWRQWHLMNDLGLGRGLTPVLLLDGEDDSRSFFVSSQFIRQLSLGTWSSQLADVVIAKREQPDPGSRSNKKGLHAILRSVWKTTRLRLPTKEVPISFGIPEELILNSPREKTRVFASHIVDPEVRVLLKLRHERHLFFRQEDYFRDIQESRFGVTTKRCGWDCLRHYEIAANRSLICFRDLDKKSDGCAPHGLGQENCIIYKSAIDLMEKCKRLSDERYTELEACGWEWIKTKTTKRLARELVAMITKHRRLPNA